MSDGSSPIGQLSGQVIGGRYRLGDQLGQGGMGVVYTATQESLARPVALKVLQPMLAQNGEAILRFRAEAERAGRLAHPHIVQILDFGHEQGGSAWIAMELLQGESLAARIERGPLSEAEVVRIAKETLAALEAAHAASLVHRDLKPDNIFLANVPGIGASVKVLDFGIAKLLDDEGAGKLTATGMLIGTPLYMAPEQARGDDVDQRADLYALGAVLYEALTGRPPFTGKNYNALLFSVLSETPQPIESFRPDISPELSRVIAHAMQKTPAQRFQSAREMADALRAFQPSANIPILRASGDPGMATAPTMATPVPAEPAGASTPVMGGTGTRSGPNAAVTPLAATTPASLPAPSAPPVARAPTPHDVKTQQGFRWWPIALAGGALAMATLAFVSVSVMSGAGSEDAAVAIADTSAPPGAAATGASAPLAELEPIEPVAAVAVEAAPTPSLPSDPAIAQNDEQPMPRGSSREARAEPEEPARRPARPRPVPRPSVRFSGGTIPGYSSSDLRPAIDSVDLRSCWPAGVPAPVVNQGRDFILDVAADGAVSAARVAPSNEEPVVFASCVVQKLSGLTFPPPSTGAATQIRVGFHIEGPY